MSLEDELELRRQPVDAFMAYKREFGGWRGDRLAGSESPRASGGTRQIATDGRENVPCRQTPTV